MKKIKININKTNKESNNEIKTISDEKETISSNTECKIDENNDNNIKNAVDATENKNSDNDEGKNENNNDSSNYETDSDSKIKVNMKKKHSEKNIKKERNPKKIIKRIAIVFGCLIISVILGFTICYNVFKEDIIKNAIQSSCFNELSNDGTIKTISNLELTGVADGKEFNKYFNIESRVSKDFYYTNENNESIFNGFDFSKIYADKDYVYMKSVAEGNWYKLKFKDMFGQDSEPYMLFGTPLSISFNDDSVLSSDDSNTYVTQKITLKDFFNYIGEDITSDDSMFSKVFGDDFEIKSDSFYVEQKFEFDSNSYAIHNMSFKFSEPLQVDDKGNELNIKLIISYSSGKPSEFNVPKRLQNVKEKSAKEFKQEDDVDVATETTKIATSTTN